MSTQERVSVIDHSALAINDPADMAVQFVQVAGTTALVIDDLYQYPDYVRQLALDLSFHRSAGAYPGYLAFVSISTEPILRLVNELMRGPLGCELRFTHAYQDDMTFAVITKRGDELAPEQRRPHTDGFCDYAGLVYLNLPEQCAGGTSFWRNRKSGVEVEPGAPGSNPVLAKLAVASQNGGDRASSSDDTPGYLTESTATWELTQVLEMRYNRFVMYSSYLYHSPLYDERDFGTSLNERRLTQNLYFARCAAS